MKYLAHIKIENGAVREQTIADHSDGTARIAKKFAQKIGFGALGELLGLLHDLAKYCLRYQHYIRSSAGVLQPGNEGYINPKSVKGKIDHSTAGAQLVWEEILKMGGSKHIAQILALCICSHHGGLIDCLDLMGKANYLQRIKKDKKETSFDEALNAVMKEDEEIINRIYAILEREDFDSNYKDILKRIKDKDSMIKMFYMGLLIRFLYSCLIDADRIDTADFESNKTASLRQMGKYKDWDVLIEKLEAHLSRFDADTPINEIRQRVSLQCLKKALNERGIFPLIVPTGIGKTLASLRFALHHAKKHKFDHIIYVIPYLSILDQNVNVIKEIFEAELPESEKGKIILEYHSNLVGESNENDSEEQRIRKEILSQNLDAPVIFTTSVHFLNVLFGGKTSDSRHFHQLANSMIIFDEIQTLPVKCAHIFCNAINFLVEVCGSSVMLCTATRPVLDEIDPHKGRLDMTPENEIVPDMKELFDKLKRVEIIDGRKFKGWEIEEISQLAHNNAIKHGSCLTIVNTKTVAKKVYQELQNVEGIEQSRVFHLSTNMCPRHRLKVLKEMCKALDEKREGKNNAPVICISTQLIEAGIDLDFATVIRSVAGLDSIAQAAGRCNRNGLLEKGYVFIVDIVGEKIDDLKDIKIGQEQAIRILDDIKNGEYRETFGEAEADILSPEIVRLYFQYYFHRRKDEMSYKVGKNKDKVAIDDNLLNILSENKIALNQYTKNSDGQALGFTFMQAFKTAGQIFEPIDDSTFGIIVPYEDKQDKTGKMSGKDIIAELCSIDDVRKQKKLLKNAQQYSINIFSNIFTSLWEKKIIYEVREGAGIYALSEQHYDNEFGFSTEKIADFELQNF